ncbi:MAG: SDR family NAD(P)-dependent oxidoreductase, partial [Flavobacteriales bacterium]|nr:SDR family NAD(P)-dependent oxidoreductase [Flavobacteriales bacterium]
MEKTVIVTGAAKGIGKAIAQNLVNSGYKVLAVDPDEVNGRALEKSLPGKLDYAAIDICD